MRIIKKHNFTKVKQKNKNNINNYEFGAHLINELKKIKEKLKNDIHKKNRFYSRESHF